MFKRIITGMTTANDGYLLLVIVLLSVVFGFLLAK